jgi:hypothetical protein
MPAARPSFLAAWQRFVDVKIPVSDVGKLIGGKVQQNIAARFFQNACPVRMSYVLNYCGIAVPPSGYHAVSGADGKWYIYRVKDMVAFLGRSFGTADRVAAKPTPRHFAGLKGIIAVSGHGWDNAGGHLPLWNGNVCSDQCHLLRDPDNGTFVPETASLWSLP